MEWIKRLFGIRPAVRRIYANEEEEALYSDAALELVYPKLSFLSEYSHIWASRNHGDQARRGIESCKEWADSIEDEKMRRAVWKWIRHSEQGLREFSAAFEKRDRVNAIAAQFKKKG